MYEKFDLPTILLVFRTFFWRNRPKNVREKSRQRKRFLARSFSSFVVVDFTDGAAEQHGKYHSNQLDNANTDADVEYVE